MDALFEISLSSPQSVWIISSLLSSWAYAEWIRLQSMGSNFPFLSVANLNKYCFQLISPHWNAFSGKGISRDTEVPRVYIVKSLSLSSLRGSFFWYKALKRCSLILWLISYLNPPAIPNLYSGMERTARFRRWCGEGNGGGVFLHSNEGSSLSHKALGLIFADRQKYISLWLSIFCLTALRSQTEVGGAQGDQDCFKNSHFSFSCKALTDT